MDLAWQSNSPGIYVARPRNLTENSTFGGVDFHDTIIGNQALRLFEIRNAEIILWDYGVIVLDAKGRRIENLCQEIFAPINLDDLRIDDVKRLHGRTLSIAHWLPENYCHSVLSMLPLIGVFLSYTKNNYIDNILSDKMTATFMPEVMNVYNFSANSIASSRVGRYKIDRLFAFEPLKHPAHVCHVDMRGFFDRMRHSVRNKTAKRKIILDRKTTRRISNIEELQGMFPQFETITLDDSPTLLEQVRLFAEADVVIGAHGAGLTNLVFMKPESALVEIFQQAYGTPCYWAISALRGVSYAACSDRRGQLPFSEHAKYDDIEVNIDSIKSALTILGKISVKPAKGHKSRLKPSNSLEISKPKQKNAVTDWDGANERQ